MSMAHSLELRVPLIDAHLAKCLQSIPGAWKLNGRVPKPLLVHALGRQLPESIVRRPKQGFTLPFDSWLRQEMRRGVEATLTGEKQNCLSSILNMAAVREVWKDFLAGRTSWSRPWSLFVLAKWCDLHL
jgi:asparagine synthase (glutamine-hydrolysing)